ncbi:MAG: cardiolipin synthase [Bacteroidales bacterium]|nr:cardiolipin synthase [Bacteroidales bacterium]
MIETLGTYINMHWISVALTVLYFGTIIATIVVILSENRSPVKSLAWVTVLLLLPVLGLVLYIVFGRNITNTRMISRRNRRKLRRQESYRKVNLKKTGLDNSSLQQIQLAKNLSGAIFYPNNKVKVYINGQDKFKDLLRDLDNARTYINIQYYIFHNDTIGKQVSDALVRAAKRGVTVRMIYDHVGSFRTSDSFFRKLKKEGVAAYPFFKVVFPPFGTRINWRNHRKICVIDGAIGYIGGMNVADRYIDGGKQFKKWRDTHLRITGPAVGGLQYSFAVDWNFMGQPLIEDSVTIEERPGGVGLQLLTSGPTSQWTNLEFLFTKAIANAKKRVYIQTPYFLPTEGLLRALQTAALSGVDVRVMVPNKSDSLMLDHATRSYFVECLKAGIKLYLYDGGMLHAKMVLVDEELVSIGSTNFDFRSFEHNFEANMQIYSSEVNQQMDEVFRQDLRESRRVRLNEWKKRPITQKAAASIIRLLSPIL